MFEESGERRKIETLLNGSLKETDKQICLSMFHTWVSVFIMFGMNSIIRSLPVKAVISGATARAQAH